MPKNYYLLFILVLAFSLRFFKLGEYGAYIDEKFTYITSQGMYMQGANQPHVFKKPTFTPKEFWQPRKPADYLETVGIFDSGVHIVYTIMLKGWTLLVGIDDFWVRIPSVIFGILTILLLYYFVKDNFRSENLALFSAFILTLEPLHIGLCRQARGYSLSIFLTLLGTFLFLKIIRGTYKKQWLLYVLYTITFAGSILNHYMAGIIFLGHGLYILLFVKNYSKWLKLGLSAIIASICIFAWFNWGGGHWSFQFLKDKNIVLAGTAKLGIMTGVCEIPTWQVLVKFMHKIFLDLFLTSNGTYSLLYHFNSLYFTLRSIISILIIIANLWLVLSFLKNYRHTPQFQKRLHCFFLFVIIFPQIYLVYDALKNNHTGNITQRYSAFAMPYLAILVGTLLLEIPKQTKWIRYIVVFIFSLQLAFVGNTIFGVLSDKAPKYTTRYGEPRIKNPYKTAADKIISTYQAGDTIVYPSYSINAFTPVIKNEKHLSILDAQYTNIFLPQDAEYIQKVNPKEPNKIIIQNKDRKIEIFDFQGDKYRY